MARPSKRFFPEYESHGNFRVGFRLVTCWQRVLVLFLWHISFTSSVWLNLAFHFGGRRISLPSSKNKRDGLLSSAHDGSETVMGATHTFLSGRQTVSLFHCLWNARGAPITVPNPHKFQYMWFLVLFFFTIADAGGPEANTNYPVVPTWSCHNCCHGKAIRNPFSHGDDVWQNAVGLEAPEVRTQPSKSCLHLMEANPKWWEIFKKCWYFWLSDLFTFIFPFSSMSSSQPRSLPSLYDYGRSTF